MFKGKLNNLNKYSYALVTCGLGKDSTCTYKDFLSLMATFFNYLVMIAVPLAILGIGIGALYMIVGAGSETNRSKGKEIVFDSIIGLVIVSASWLIINLVITGLGATGFNNPLK